MSSLKSRADRAIAERLIRTDALLRARREHMRLFRRSVNLRIALLQYHPGERTDAERAVADLIASYHHHQGTLERALGVLGMSLDRQFLKAIQASGVPQ